MVFDSTDHFDRLAARYSELRASPSYVDPVTEAVVALGSSRGCRVLDVGCVPDGETLRRELEEAELRGVQVEPF